MRKLLSSVIIITAISIPVISVTRAFFHDTETSNNNTFMAGALDLLIDSTCHYWQNDEDVGCKDGQGNFFGTWEATNLSEIHKFFNFSDIKPGDYGEDTVSIRVETNDSWVCSEITVTESSDNGHTEPELALDTPEDTQFSGELDQELQFLIWGDDGDNVLEDNELPSIQSGRLRDLVGDDRIYTLSIADSSVNIWGENGPLPGGITRYVGMAWCFGEIAPAALAQGTYDASANPGFTCNGDLVTDISQTDKVLGDISFTAVQERNNPNFVCGGGTACELDQVYTASVVLDMTQQGTLKNGSNITDPARINPANANGAPDNQFFSIGFGGYVVLEFAGSVGIGAGDDLIVHEITNGRASYPEEKALVEVSDDGTNWHLAGTASSTNVDGTSSFDLDSLPITTFRYVRLTDTTVQGPHLSTADGFDLDAVEAVYGACTF